MTCCSALDPNASRAYGCSQRTICIAAAFLSQIRPDVQAAGKIAISEAEAQHRAAEAMVAGPVEFEAGLEGHALIDAQTAPPLTFSVPAGSEAERSGPEPKN